MKAKKEYWFIAIVALLMVAIIASACGGPAEEEPVVEEPPVQEEEAEPEEPGAEAITLRYLALNDPDQLLAYEWKSSHY